jgi:hypothetical protein
VAYGKLGLKPREFYSLSLQEFRELSEAVEYDRQSQLSYQRHLIYSLLMAQGVKNLSIEKFLPLPLIDGNPEDRLKIQREEIMELGRKMFENRKANGGIKSKINSGNRTGRKADR